ncbi:5'/3'-nucleotidase SurE [Brevibacillus dissolubilis]|uniref:5'/3'-nucleotidase SurE n=1 Tax=Brevibacillus dissolubilis TaxID=1844116 RepID=UPI001116EFE4|nr:5'/3'-nucleotidase SurE [Brevibacillus dissolubilis]
MQRILVTNDDGIHALGIRKLVEALLTIPDLEIYVVAPDEERSGVGHGVTMRSGLSPEKQDFYGLPVQAWAVNGNPADCVKAAYHLLFTEDHIRPTIVFSGINVGNNLGKDVYYSGTCSAAREAVILGIPAVALSYDNYFDQQNYGEVEEIIKPLLLQFTQQAKNNEMPHEVFWNINIPHLPAKELKGYKPAVLSLYHYHDIYNEKENGGYWLERTYREAEEHHEDEDYRVLRDGYVAVTPIHIDSTDRSLLQAVSNWPVVQNGKQGE